MDWKLFANLAETAGRREVTVDAEAATVGGALDALLAEYPGLREEVCDEDGELRQHIQLLVDGEDPFANADGYETPVPSDAELALFPPVSGG
jgi:molybdopterin synthase sulfur carrier subunit